MAIFSLKVNRFKLRRPELRRAKSLLVETEHR
jgi:hypothetical protein